MALCGYSNCFREAVKMRGFLWVCPVHLADPVKRPDNGSTFVKQVDSEGGRRA